MRKKQSVISKLNNNLLQKILDESNSYIEVLKKLGVSHNGGGTYKTLINKIKENKLDLEKINENRKKLIKKRNIQRIIPTNKILVKNSLYMNTNNLKQRLLKEGLLKNKCYECGQLPFHNGKQLTLQIDHVNGDRKDNRLKNLRILCPNCHTQTKNYGFKNSTKYKIFNICINCGTKICSNTKTSLCFKCIKKENKSKIRPVKKILIADIINLPIIHVGKKYGVSDTAVRKWLKYYNLPYKRKEIKEYMVSVA